MRTYLEMYVCRTTLRFLSENQRTLTVCPYCGFDMAIDHDPAYLHTKRVAGHYRQASILESMLNADVDFIVGPEYEIPGNIIPGEDIKLLLKTELIRLGFALVASLLAGTCFYTLLTYPR